MEYVRLYHSPLFNEDIAIIDGNELYEGDMVTYTSDELSIFKRLSEDQMRHVHSYKKIFGGRVNSLNIQ